MKPQVRAFSTDVVGIVKTSVEKVRRAFRGAEGCLIEMNLQGVVLCRSVQLLPLSERPSMVLRGPLEDHP
jgi:hypothetical protein